MLYTLTLVTSNASSNGTAYQTRQDRRNRAFQEITDLTILGRSNGAALERLYMFYTLTLVTSNASSNGTAYQSRQGRRNRAFHELPDLVDHSWLFQWAALESRLGG